MKLSATGHVVLEAKDDADFAVDQLIANGYPDDFCLCPVMDPAFVSRLMVSGFLVMSTRIHGSVVKSGTILLPKLHTQRLVLSPGAVHEPRSVKRLLGRYELRSYTDFDAILRACVRTHGDDWLTPELCAILSDLHGAAMMDPKNTAPGAKPASFALYREGALVAGEIGIMVGRAYTSYSGFRLEDSAGTVQLVLTGRFLKESGFSLWDLGMPMAYKERLGARTVDRAEFISLFRFARSRV